MSRFGVDYSFARPTPGELKAAGVTFACRYIGTPSSGKNLTLTEADQLRAAGIDLVANFEANNAGWMQGGRTAGVNAAKAAHADATRLGMPPSRPIYFSADYNATFDQYKTQIRPCLEGAASVIGASRVGIYGGLEQVDWAYRDGIAPWVWQTYAWSYGQWSSHGHIQQYKNGQKLGSGTVDYDRAVQADFGQWSAQGDGDMSYEDWTDAGKDAFWKAANNKIAEVVIHYLDHGNTDDGSGDHHQAIRKDLAVVKAALASLTGEIDATQTAIANLQLASVDPVALAAALSPLIGADLADKVAAELSARLAQ